jgi:site-specific DNA recombinase
MDEILTDQNIELLADAFEKAQHDDHDAVLIRAQQSQLAEVNRKITNINNAIAEGIWSASTADMLRDLEQTRSGLQESIAALKVRPPEVPRQAVIEYLQEVKRGESSNLRNAVIDLFIRRIYLQDDAENGHTRALFEFSMDGSGGEPETKEIILSEFEQSRHSSTSRNLNEPTIRGKTALIVVTL